MKRKKTNCVQIYNKFKERTESPVEEMNGLNKKQTKTPTWKNLQMLQVIVSLAIASSIYYNNFFHRVIEYINSFVF